MALPNEPENPAWKAEDYHEDMPIMGITMCFFPDEFSSHKEESCQQNLNTVKITKLFTQDAKDASLVSSLDEEWKEEFLKEKFSLISGLLYNREKDASVVLLPRKEEQDQIFIICQYDVTSGHLSIDKTIGKISSAAWWPKWK